MATSVLSSFTPQFQETGIQQLLETGVTYVPDAYIVPPHLRDRPDEVTSDRDIPVIDLSGYDDDERRAEIVDQIRSACEEWGFFQVQNHGVDVENVLKMALKFYELPTEEKKRLPDRNDGSGIAFNTGFNAAPGEARDWKDYLAIWRRPGTCDGFEHAPQILREGTLRYRAELDKLAAFLYDAIFQSLGLSEEYRKSALPNIGRLVMIYNFYPQCPDPRNVRGASPHSDISSFTILLQGDVAGLQVRKDGKWVPVKPVPNALVINVSDQIEMLTNGRYESVEHRATAPSDRLRMTVASFYGPSEDTVIAPLPALIDENNPPKFRATRFSDYLRLYRENNVKCYKDTLDHFRL